MRQLLLFCLVAGMVCGCSQLAPPPGPSDPTPEPRDSTGAIILVSASGVTIRNNATGAVKPAKAGDVTHDGHTVITGKERGSKAVLLFSNGTVITLEEDSKLNLKTFTQTKFKATGDKISALEQEPSVSSTFLDLEVGELVADVKRGNNRSRFDVSSSIGTIGIRGTTFALNARPLPGGGLRGIAAVGKGLVHFTPPSPRPTPGIPNPPWPHPTSLSQGEVMSVAVTAAGVPVVSPPAPAPAAQLAAMQATVSSGNKLTAEITLNTVAAALSEVAAKAKKRLPPPARPKEVGEEPEPDDPDSPER